MARSGRATLLRQALIVLGTFLVVALLCAWIWHAWWTPAPTGVVVDKKVYYEPDQEFRGTGIYMVLAALAGVVLGIVFAFLFDHDEVTTLVVVVVSAMLAGLLMAWFGHVLGPENATEVARRTPDFEKIHGDLRVGPPAAYVAFPGGAVLGVVAVLVTFTRRRLKTEPTG